jgi:alpha/beta superfamily hydrolase
MPGLAASSAIFERISLSDAVFEVVLLEWELPLDNETLSQYAKRMALKVMHPNPVLVGVSFGGILVQEMAQFMDARKVIIVSSVKTNLEFPKRMKVAKATKAYKLIPTNLFANIESLSAFSFGSKINQRLKLYEKFLRVRDKRYLDWAVEQVILWERTVPDEGVIHIHGDEDDVFPIKNIHNCIVVKGGTHIMILSKYKWLNENLPKIILE